MQVRSIILTEISIIAADQKKVLAPFDDSTPLLEIGFDSLCFAILVARLEEKLEVDPFDRPDFAAMPVTVGDFIGLYERAMA